MVPISNAMIMLIIIHDVVAVPVRTTYPPLLVRLDADEGRSVGTLSIVSNEVGNELLLDVESSLPLGFNVAGSDAFALGDKLGSTTGTGVGVLTGDPVGAMTGDVVDVVVALIDGKDDGSNGDSDGDAVVTNTGAVNG